MPIWKKESASIGEQEWFIPEVSHALSSWTGKISSGNISTQSGEQEVFVVNAILLGYLRLISRLYTNAPPTLFLRVNSTSKFSLGKHTDPQPALSWPTWFARPGLKVY